MARKRLGDLLRQEAEKPQDAGEEEQSFQTIEVHASSVVVETNGKANQAEMTEQAENKGGAAMGLTDSTIKELNSSITELKQALQAASTKETELQAHIDQLQGKLQEQTGMIQKLQQEQPSLKQLKTELEQAKQTIIQLTELNSEPPAKQPMALAKSQPKGQAAIVKPGKSPSSDTRDLRSHKTLIERLPSGSVHPHEQPRISNTEIGWFD